MRRSKRSCAIRERLAAEKSSASFGHHAPDAPKPVIVWAAREHAHGRHRGRIGPGRGRQAGDSDGSEKRRQGCRPQDGEG